MKYFSTRAVMQLCLNFKRGTLPTAGRVAVLVMFSIVFVLVLGVEIFKSVPAPAFSQTINPQSGWVYVLDSGGMKRESQVLLVDPDQERVIRTFKTGYGPDMVLSPDGTRLFLASNIRSPEGKEQSVLDVIDTASGAVLTRVNNPDRWISTLPAYPSQMVVSADGRMLYVFKQRITDDSNYLVAFDVLAGQFLPEKAELLGCITAQLFPLPASRQLAVVCASKSDVRFLNLTDNGAVVPTPEQASATSKLSLAPWAGAHEGQNVGAAVASANGSNLKVIMGDGRFVKIDTGSRKVQQTDVIDSSKRKRATNNTPLTNTADNDWLAGRWVRFQIASPSADGTRLFMGVGRVADLREGKQWFDQIAVLDPQTLERLAVINTSQSFYSLAIAKDGRRLYAIDTEGASLLVVDTETNREIRKLQGFAQSPAFAIVAP